MDLEEEIRRGKPEGERIEYKSKEAAPRKVAKEIAAMSNAAGGSIVLGVREDSHGRPGELEDIGSTDEIARSVSDVLSHVVEPVPDFSTDILEIDGKSQLAIIVESTEELLSYEHRKIEEPLFPVRRQTEVRYLNGHEVQIHYRDQVHGNSKDDDERLLRIPDSEGEPSNYFIECPDGHISELCLFTPHYFPNNPYRVVAQLDYISEARAEHVFSVLEGIFGLSVPDCHFTINQSNGAWIGSGYENFVANLRNRESRYLEVEDSGYELKLYDHDQAVLISDLDVEYPESSVLIYAAPFTSEPGYRHLTVNFLIDGQPVDVRPLVEFSEQSKMRLSTAKGVEIDTQGLPSPDDIPVDLVERTTRTVDLDIESEASIDGAICANPFYGKRELLENRFSIDGAAPISNYSRLRAFLRDWDQPEDPHEYTAQRFQIADWNDFTRGVYANVKQIHFGINW
ncbi:helix-turn-helix domain-containing protein [Halorubrum sp. CSM-61]|uniref:AlbA family DNA-binding domain-containing protein n=1 Tax=Halorubrum sp. CSM-61 TaxID=2485838 RepID=UPI000F4CFBF0|nr:ATP-binding protein [Halorubrum sp. CSM-61]